MAQLIAVLADYISLYVGTIIINCRAYNYWIVVPFSCGVRVAAPIGPIQEEQAPHIAKDMHCQLSMLVVTLTLKHRGFVRDNLNSTTSS